MVGTLELELVNCYASSAFFTTPGIGYVVRNTKTDNAPIKVEDFSRGRLGVLMGSFRHLGGNTLVDLNEPGKRFRDFDEAGRYLRAVWDFQEYIALISTIVADDLSDDVRREAWEVFEDLKIGLKRRLHILQSIDEFKKYGKILELDADEAYVLLQTIE